MLPFSGLIIESPGESVMSWKSTQLWVISHQKLEWSSMGAFIAPGVVSEFCHREITCPIVLPIVDIKPEILFQALIGTF